MSLFSIVPIEVSMDRRLTLMHVRVLIALLSFRAKNTDTVWPKREQLAARCGGYTVQNVSKTTRELVALGWLEKEGNGGRSGPSKYRITVPDLDTVSAPETVSGSDTVSAPDTVSGSDTVSGMNTVSGSDTVSESNTVSGSDTPTVSGSDTPTVSGSDTRMEQTIEQTNEQTIVPGGQASFIPAVPETTKPSKSSLTPEMQVACRKTFEAYATAYHARYGVEPVKNAKVAGQIVQIVKRLGMEEAPNVAGFYPKHSARWYVQVGHSVDAFLKDCEKLRTEWATGTSMTSATAAQIDATQSNFNASEQAKQMLANRRGAAS